MNINNSIRYIVYNDNNLIAYTRSLYRQIENFMVMTYKIINDLESLTAQRRPKNQMTDKKEYVRTIEFLRMVTDTVAIKILNAICDKPSSSAAVNNGMAEKMLDDLKAFNDDNGGKNDSPADNTRGSAIKMGVTNAIVEILTATEEGTLMELNIKINPVAKTKPLQNDDMNNKQHASRIYNKPLVPHNAMYEARRNNCPGMNSMILELIHF